MQLEGYPKTVRTKDGSELTLRPMTAQDRDDLLAFFQGLDEVDRMFLKDDVTQPEVIDRWITGLDYNRVIPILAIRDGKVVADGTLHVDQHGWTRHIGEIRIVVASSCQGLGVGSLVARELVTLAQQRGLEKIQAQVVEDSHAAVAMLRKAGFTIEATRPKHVLDLKGKRRDLIILVNDVDNLWQRMHDMIQDTIADKSGMYSTGN